MKRTGLKTCRRTAGPATAAGTGKNPAVIAGAAGCRALPNRIFSTDILPPGRDNGMMLQTAFFIPMLQTL